jgi:sulfite exporter TauE/SafE
MTWLIAGAALGLAGSLHCAGMCGPLLLAVHRGSSRGEMMRRMATYHVARVLMYALLGMPAGYAAHALSFGMAGRTVATIAGVLLVAAAMVELAEKAAGHEAVQARRPGADGELAVGTGAIIRVGRVLSQGWSLGVLRIGAKAAVLTRRHPRYGYLALGAVNGLLPCGLVYAAIAAAAASGTIASAVTFMAGFGAGTVPLLFAVTLSAGSVPAAVRRRLRFVAPALMAVAGVLLIVRAFAPVEQGRHRHHEMPRTASFVSSRVYNLRGG